MIEELLKRLADLEQEVVRLRAVVAERDATIAHQAVRIAGLEARLNQNSSNSSKPPSTDPPWKKPKNKTETGVKNKQGAQPGHTGANRELLPTEDVDEVVSCMPGELCDCGARIEIESNSFERKQVFEIPRFDPYVSEYQIFSGCCSGCFEKFKGALPLGTPPGMLGPNALALIGILTGQYHLSKRDVEEILSDCFGLSLSLGTVCNAEQVVSDALSKPVQEAATAVQKEKVVGADETSHNVSGKHFWTWIVLTTQLAVFYVRSSRSKKVAQEALGIEFSGILVSDRYGAYKWVGRRQFCWAHLSRDIRKFQDMGGPSGKLADQISIYIKEMFSLWHDFKDDKFGRIDFQKRVKPVCLRIESLLKAGSDLPAMGRFNQAIYKDRAFLWTFIQHENVEPTNNHAERTLRQCVIWRKTSFGTQGEKGNRFVERILTTVSSCKLQGRKPLDYLREVITAHFRQQPIPSLLPLTA